MRQKTVAIIHYNTPELTEACILSIRKHGGNDYRVVVFDNSDERPFRVQMSGVEVIDNTQGQLIDFDKLLSAFPQRNASIGCAKGCDFASVRHMRTVQELWRLLPDGFLLVESDVLIKRNIDEFFRDEYSFVAYVQRQQPHNPFGIGRVLPMLCWLNVPKFVAEGVQYFDPNRTYGLKADRNDRTNWYDTGASLLEDVLSHRPRLKGLHIDIREYVEHFGSGSWKNNNLKAQAEWLKQYRKLWEPEGCKNGKVAVCAIGRLENRYAVEWVEHYNALGVDKIFIYDNNRISDGEIFADVLQPYIEAGFVEITYFEGLQKDAYEKCYRDHSDDYEWIGFFDFDELVDFANVRMTIPVWIDQYNADVLVMNWRTMTDNGLVHYDDRPMAERFTQGTGEDFEINRHVKSFVHSGIVGISFNDPHCPNAPKLNVVNVLGEQVEQVPIQPTVIHKVAWINHYNTKTAEEWATLKMRRLSPCGEEYNREMKAKNVDYFFSINKRTPEKEEILGVKPKKASKPRTTKRANSKKE